MHTHTHTHTHTYTHKYIHAYIYTHTQQYADTYSSLGRLVLVKLLGLVHLAESVLVHGVGRRAEAALVAWRG